MNNTKQLALNLFSVYSSIFLSSLPFGMTMVLIAIKMDKFVGSEILISLSAATQIFAGVLFAKYVPIIARKIGVLKTIQISSLIAATMVLLMYQYFGYFVWLFIVFIFGAALFSFSVIRQSITLDISPPHRKAIIVSTGGMLMALGSSFGAIILGYIGSDGFLPYAIAAGLYIFSMIPMMLFKDANNIVKEGKKVGLMRYIKISPKIMLGGFVFNYVQAATGAFIIIYGIQIGLEINRAAILFSVFLFGTVFSVPIGFLTDAINRRFLMMIFTLASLACAITLFFIHNFVIIAILLFLLFGFGIGIKVPALILINEKYKPTQRLAVNSAFAKVCLIGNICGIFATGAIMEILGPKGLWISIIFILFLYTLINIRSYLRSIFERSYLRGHIILNKQKH
ncbi:MAG: MFS family permease [Rickettsiales bacterium]|jgi:MFS family permease